MSQVDSFANEDAVATGTATFTEINGLVVDSTAEPVTGSFQIHCP